MTLTEEVPVTCTLCGQTSTQTELISTNRFGAPDLDLRPPPMQRNTMNTWVECCANCHYCSASIADEVPVAELDAVKNVVASAQYKEIVGNNGEPLLSSKFLATYTIAIALNKPARALLGALRASWVFDDYGDNEQATQCREKASAVLLSEISAGRVGKNGFE